MGETFYSVLGVNRDADTQTIKQAYREKVKDHHPDVSDAEDAEQTFKRLTDARDALVDDNNRKQYDRVGHNEYVHRYLDSSAWSVDAGSSGTSTGGASSSGRGRSGTGSSSRRSSGSRSQSRDSGGASNRRNRSSGRSSSSGSSSSNAEDYQRYRSGYSPEEEDHETAGQRGGSSTSSSGRAWTEADFDTSTSSANASTTNSGRDPRQRAQKDQWQTAHAAANAYSPSGRDPAASQTQQTGLTDVADAARQVGPWLAFHFVFLISAFVTVWLFVSWTPSLPTMLVAVLLLGVAIFFSILHMISRVYS